KARLSYFDLIMAALFRAGGTLSVSMPVSDGHIPPLPDGSVPQTVVNPKRTCEASVGSTCSMAFLRCVQEVLWGSSQMTLPVLPLRQWNMLPDRSTSR